MLRLCDLHVEFFKEILVDRELKELTKDHPLELLMRENEWILRNTEVLGIYAQALLNTNDPERIRQHVEVITKLLMDSRKIRLRYREIQMLVFPISKEGGYNSRAARTMGARRPGHCEAEITGFRNKYDRCI
ncbi:MAG: hypothetical protein QXN10_02395 [Desulfurococcaceae archaeon]